MNLFHVCKTSKGLCCSVLLIVTFFNSCKGQSDRAYSTENSLKNEQDVYSYKGIIENGSTVVERFPPPNGYERKTLEQGSFQMYLRNIPLKPAGTKVRLYDGSIKRRDVHEAVVDMEISNRNLQQCADAIIRLRAEYLYSQKRYNQISFSLTNGFEVSYLKWMEGNRVVVSGSKTSWKRLTTPSNTYKEFRNYLEFIFMYAGTISLEKALKPKNMADIVIGDVFIKAGSPGHAVIIVDIAENVNHEKVFLLAQSYMPAQEIHILKNLNSEAHSPWYDAKVLNELKTPEWTFDLSQLKSF